MEEGKVAVATNKQEEEQQQHEQPGGLEHGVEGAQPALPPTLLQPQALRVLVVDSKSSSRSGVCALLRNCEYQVTAVRTSAEALAYLMGQHSTGNTNGGPDPVENPACSSAEHAAAAETPIVDLVIKDHEPPASDAGRLLMKMAASQLLRKTPVVVMSSQDERETVMNCLTLGAIDYLVKPLRHNELRHIWTRVWWWRRSGLGAPLAWDAPPVLPIRPLDIFGPSYQSSDQETKCDDEEEPTSKEGSAPDGNGNGSNENNHGSNGSKDGNGTSRVEAKVHDNGNGNGNGSSDNKNGHHGSNGNGASTTLAAERNGAHPLAHTAEGRAPAGLIGLDTQTLPKVARSLTRKEVARTGKGMPRVATGRSLGFPGDVYNAPPTSSSRKRPFTQVGEAADGTPKTSIAREAAAHQQMGSGEPVPTKTKSNRAERHERERMAAADRAERNAAAERGDRGSGHGSAGQGGHGSGHGSAGRVAGGLAHVASLDTQQPSQRGQLVHGSGSAANRMEGVASASGGNGHGSGGSRTAHGTTGVSGADGNNTVSAAHFAPHHVQPSGQASLTHGANNLSSWGSLPHAPGGPVGATNAHHSQSNSFPPVYTNAFGLAPHLLPPPLQAALSMYAARSPTVSGPTPDLHAGLNPLAVQQLLAMQLGQQVPLVVPATAGAAGSSEPAAAPLEGCSSGGAKRGSRANANDTSGSMTGFPPNPMLMQYLQAMSQLGAPNQFGANLAGILPGSMVQAPALQGSLPPAAQAALAMAWAASAGAAGGLPGVLPGAPPSLFSASAAHPHPHPHVHPHHHHHHHPHPHSSSNHPIPTMASGNTHPGALPLAAMQLPLLAHPALSIAVAGVMPGSTPPPGATAATVPTSVTPGLSVAAETPGSSAAAAGIHPAVGADPSTLARLSGVRSAGGDAASRQALLMLGGMGGMMLHAPSSLMGSTASLQPSGCAGNKEPTGLVPQLGMQALLPEAVGNTRKRRALALDKYRMKRKNLKFSSAIRYETRKAQAQARPRIKGQFAKASAPTSATKAHSTGTGLQGSTAGGGEGREEGDEEMPAARGVPGEEEDEEYDHGADADDNDMEEDEDEACDRVEGQGASITPPQRSQSASPAIESNANRWSSRHRPGRSARCVSGPMGVRSRLAQGDANAGWGQDGAAQAQQPLGGPQDVDMLPPPQGAELCEDEEDVVDSLRELKEGNRHSGHTGHHHHRPGSALDGQPHSHNSHPPSAGAAAERATATSGFSDGKGAGAHDGLATGHGQVQGAPQASLSMGSQSGLAASKGSLGRTSQHQRGGSSMRAGSNLVAGLAVGSQGERDMQAVRGDSGMVGLYGGGAVGAAVREGRGDTRDLEVVAQAGGQRASSHGREPPARSAGITTNSSHPDVLGNNANNGKNGSDSGSNSPDENGNGGSGGSAGNEGVDQAAHGGGSHGHGHGQQQHAHHNAGHRHDGHR